MIEADWTWLREVSLWQLALVIVAVWIILRGLVKLWPGLRNTIRLIDAVGELPAFMSRTERTLGEVHHEVHYNNGTSVKDAITRVERGVAGLYQRADESDKKLEEHVHYSQGWKARLDEVDERTQPPKEKP